MYKLINGVDQANYGSVRPMHPGSNEFDLICIGHGSPPVDVVNLARKVYGGGRVLMVKSFHGRTDALRQIGLVVEVSSGLTECVVAGLCRPGEASKIIGTVEEHVVGLALA